MRKKYMIYAVSHDKRKTEYTNKKDAVAHARALRKDGWVAHVRDMRTGEIIF